jgi:CheY-like chemotaxis protein
MKFKQLNILLADDDTDDCIFFKEALGELLLSTSLTIVNDGEELMQLLTNEPITLPHVLFLDLNMPRKNGFECLAELKLSKKLKQLPVIVFSTSFEQEVVNQLYKSGAQYYIRKPSEFSQFKQIIQLSLALIMKNTVYQPIRENFVITVETSFNIGKINKNNCDEELLPTSLDSGFPLNN